MVFSDTTAKDGIIQQCELLTGLGDAGISGDATLLKIFTGLLNRAYHKTILMILSSQDAWDFDDSNYTDFPSLTTALVANQRDYEIPVSEKVLQILRVDVTYDNSQYYKAEPFDISETGLGMGPKNNSTSENEIDGRFSKTEPKYDTKYNSIWLYPRASQVDVDAGATLKIEWTREISEFVSTDTTKVPGFDTPFHPLLAIIASQEFSVADDLKRANQLQVQINDWETRLADFYGHKEVDRQYVLKPAFINYK